MEYKENGIDTTKMSPVAAGLTGLIIGVVGTAAIVLSDEETRKKASKKAQKFADKLKKMGDKTLSKYQEKIDTTTEETKKVLGQTKDEFEKNLESAAH